MKANTRRATRIGIFVVTSFVLLILIILVVSSGRLFNESYKFVVYFNKSLNGLVVGAPVSLYGVDVGRVDAIQIVNNHEEKSYSLPITIELDKETFFNESSALFSQKDAEEVLKQYIERGLRAELKSKSLVASTLYIELAFLDETQAELLSSDWENLPRYEDMMQIPTIASSLDGMLESIANIPFDDVVAHADTVLLQISAMLASIQNIMDKGEVSNLLVAYTDLANNVSEEVVEFGTLRSEFTNLASNLNKAVDSNDKNVAELIENINSLSASADEFISKLNLIVTEDSSTMIELTKTMYLLQDASKSIAELAEILTQNPESLIYGKK